MPVTVSINDLDPECLRLVFSCLPPRQCAQAACVQRLWRQLITSDEQLWAAACEADYAVGKPQGPDGNPLSSFSATYRAWRLSFGHYGTLASRACHCWRRLEQWTAAHMPAIRESLRPGASEASLDEAEQALKVRLPAAMRLIYRLHDGQVLQYERGVHGLAESPFHTSMLHGLFGGYSFYNHVVSTRMLSLASIVGLSIRFRSAGLLTSDRQIVFAMSFEFRTGCKMFLLDTESGDVLASPLGRAETIHAAPAAGPETLLHWLEAYTQRLEAGVYRVSSLLEAGEPEVAGINLFPAAPPLQVCAVTRGVEVKASVVFVPELSSTSAIPSSRYFFAYSIRFALLSEEDQRASGEVCPLASVQLLARHWQILDAAGGVDSEIRGEAVVGQYPLLKAGGPDFVYQSCTHQKDAVGAMQGSFRFVVGSMAMPTGPEFDVECPKFMLELPQFIF